MPLTVQVDYDRRLVYMTGTDPLVCDDVMAVLYEQPATGTWPYDALWDLSQCSFAPSAADVNTLVSVVDVLSFRHGPRGRTAIVTGDDNLAFGMARMFALLSESRRVFVQAFRTEPQALAWLAIPIDPNQSL